MFTFNDFALSPGNIEVVETIEAEILWGNTEYNRSFRRGGVILDDTTDEGNTGQASLLRPGLLMGQITASGKYTDWAIGASDGSENIAGVLLFAQEMQRLNVAQDRWFGFIQTGGMVKAEQMVIPGSSAALSGEILEDVVRAQMRHSFIFDDTPTIEDNWGGWNGVITNVFAGDGLTLTRALHNNKIIDTVGSTGTATITLPAVASSYGKRFGVYCGADFDVKVQSPTANTLITYGDVAATSIEIATATAFIVGCFLEIIGLKNGFWNVIATVHPSTTIDIL